MAERSFFRLRLPLAATLPLLTNHGEFAVCELSEGGLRIRCDADSGLSVGQGVVGTLVLSSGERIEVKGVAVRREQDELVVTQAEGVTFQHMMREQRHLVQKYPSTNTPPSSEPPES